MQRKSQELAKDWRRKISILFIDGDHSYEQSKFDFDTFYPFVEGKGLIIFHDTNFPQLPVAHKGCEEIARGIKDLNKLDFLKKPGLMVFQKG
ncbi:MAG: hypothetical protein GH145_04980 [Firmicutes bacterium]|nr:hypothetical protein [Bacillota bacterium]